LEETSENGPPTRLFETLIAYTERSYVVSKENVQSEMIKGRRILATAKYKICIIAVDSVGYPREMLESQCIDVSYKTLKYLATSNAHEFIPSSILVYFVSLFITLNFF